MSESPRKRLKTEQQEKKSVPMSAFAAFLSVEDHQNSFHALEDLQESTSDKEIQVICEPTIQDEESTSDRTQTSQNQPLPLQSSGNNISPIKEDPEVLVNRFYADVLGRSVHIENMQVSVTGLKTGDCLCLHGIYQLTCIKGSLEILGYHIDAQPGNQWHTVYAPSTHSLPVIITHETSSNHIYTEIYNELQNSGKISDLEMYDTLVGIRSLKSNLLNLQNVYPPARHIWGPQDRLPPSMNKFPCVPINTKTPPISIMLYPDSWKTIVDHVLSHVRKPSIQKVLICGPKSVGKSSFAKYLINRFVSSFQKSKAHFLDLDPGQPEFGPAGMISLHAISDAILGPPFSYPQSPNLIQAHDIGDTSPQDNPEHYVACVQGLYGITCTQNPLEIPLIINTLGWIKGQGVEILADLINSIEPTHIVYLGPQLEAMSSEIARLLLGDPRLVILTSASELNNLTYSSPTVSPSELRTLSTMSYFHSAPTPGVENCNFSPLVGHSPWIASYEGEFAGVDAIAIFGSIVDSDNVAMVINASIVAIVIYTPSDRTIWENGIVPTPEGLPYLNLHGQYLDPKNSQCIGYAIVRGINVKTKELELLSPIDPALLETEDDSKLILLRGKLELPVWAFLEGSSNIIAGRSWNDAPYLTTEPEKGAGSQFSKSRRNISRRSAGVDIY
ncbi:Polynucleotide 5'-hydroxyl-kinase grc3 [Neolecta irregularis DAH-3]|uniref:Polynucleotide 5'-hydroxyl-kinase GRC3 n=1 Tax=Neolecta irregularis (strain DAH-3) TaxID=1198029 RepID=A0A1U7LJJ0_NEOID|nr:Polynucleotide 5'-hydroxyl-kinase grc3 [Neolecta irregularis DAH-3]|eukprot:OLL22814.1 Polynucleotide 5'-hydroxyl-kinase grc3 [Neolecta irregularis DAH-3]